MTHVPVLCEEAIGALNVREGGLYLDGTFGGGGYTRILLARGARVVALDRDPTAIAGGAALAAAYPERLRLVPARFSELDKHTEPVDGVVLDIGVSSMQIDEPARGFSLRFDAPLDMRMEGQGQSAADLLAESSEAELADIFFHFGEERAARRIARAIVADRPATPFVSTRQLASLVARLSPAPPGEHTHPATRVFQALRIAVNDELGELSDGLAGSRASAQTRRKARRGDVPLARRSHRQTILGQPNRARPRRLAAVAGGARAAGVDLQIVSRPTRDAKRIGNRRQPTREIGETAFCRAARGWRVCRLRGPRRGFREKGALMWRLLHLLAIGTLIGSAVYVYTLKYQAIFEAEQIVKIKHQISKAKDEIGVLRAEYEHLARPDRIQELADKLLQMQPLALNQIVRPEEIPEKNTQADSIGRKLELMGLGPTSSPANGAAGASPSLR